MSSLHTGDVELLWIIWFCIPGFEGRTPPNAALSRVACSALTGRSTSVRAESLRRHSYAGQSPNFDTVITSMRGFIWLSFLCCFLGQNKGHHYDHGYPSQTTSAPERLCRIKAAKLLRKDRNFRTPPGQEGLPGCQLDKETTAEGGNINSAAKKSARNNREEQINKQANKMNETQRRQQTPCPSEAVKTRQSCSVWLAMGGR